MVRMVNGFERWAINALCSGKKYTLEAYLKRVFSDRLAIQYSVFLLIGAHEVRGKKV